MRKRLLSMIALAIVFSLSLSLAGCGEAAQETEQLVPIQEQKVVADKAENEDLIKPAEDKTEAAEEADEEEPEKEELNEQEPKELDASTVLFIGDSRTVGLYEYSGLTSDFFAGEGMSVYNIFDNYSNVGGRGYTQLKPLLEKNDYSVIFLMLGLNEIGYPFDEVMEKFETLVNYIREAEPEAELIIMANLHVTGKYSDGHPYITNPNINELNSLMSEYADGENVFFLDVSGVYDDEEGGLRPELTSDGVHFYAKYYIEWAQWIMEQAAEILGCK